MKPKLAKIIFRIILIAVVIVAILLTLSFILSQNKQTKMTLVEPFLTKKVMEYKPLVEDEAKKNQVENHIPVILGMMMQESGGRGSDPMQSSESLCGEVGCIDDPSESIAQGVAYFSKALKASENDVYLAVQSYNFGLGFIDYVKENGGRYTQEVAIDFSQKMYREAKDKSIYTCLREEAKEFDACYGDIYYVRDVMEHREQFIEMEDK